MIQVNCEDRRGLLLDVVLALKALPLQIMTAAITTTKDGNVYDVFQVQPDPGASLTQQSLQYKVHLALQHQGGAPKRPHWAQEEA